MPEVPGAVQHAVGVDEVAARQRCEEGLYMFLNLQQINIYCDMFQL